MELLAPAGDMACLEAAIDAGADAVYLGLSLLNARRSARNFTPGELGRAVETAEKRQVKTYLTLNTDITVRETGAAARILSIARDAGVSAVIVRDMAAVELWRVMAELSARSGCHCPALHLSTQTAITNAEGVRLAAGLGASRVVLARELALEEIRAVKAGAGEVELEVFAQGALCYSISGRCLMSSWGGGRSGNRGLCTSPCRAPWSVDGDPVGAAMSMRDLVTVDRLRELKDAGVAAIKIEGRLKKPEWVRDAVGLYRAALGPRERPENAVPADAAPGAVQKARELAAYAGRDVTSAYLDGSFRGLTGVASRKASSIHRAAIDELEDDHRTTDGRPRRRDPEGYGLSVEVTDKGVSCRVGYKSASESWRMPKTRIKREKKAVSIAELFTRLSAGATAGIPLAYPETNQPDFMLPPRNVKAIAASVAAFLNRVSGKDDGADSVMKAPLPEDMRKAARPGKPHRDNRRVLGEKPNQVRVTVKQLNSTLLPILNEVELVIQNAGPEEMEFVEKFIDPAEAVFSFPEIFFPGESGDMRRLAEYLKRRNIRAEANCWGSLRLCREYGLNFSAGPGLSVLNHVAAAGLRDLGAESVVISVEADKKQIEDIVQASPVPLSLVVYARPPLAYTRIPEESLLANGNGGKSADGEWRDRRGIGLHPERNASVTVFRSLTPFSWAGLVNKKIRVCNLVMDLSADSSPVAAWKNFIKPPLRDEFLFNYDRGLK